MVRKEDLKQFIEAIGYLNKSEIIGSILFFATFIIFIILLPIIF